MADNEIRAFELAKATRFIRQREQLSEHEVIHLRNIVEQPGYGVLLRFMQMEAEFFETELLNTPNGDRDMVLAHHARAQAVWQWLESVQNRIEQALNPE